MAHLQIRQRSDATRLHGESPRILMHVLSDELIWGLGFTQSIDSRWPVHSQGIQRRLRVLEPRPVLGEVLWTEVEPGLALAHLVVERSRGTAPIGLSLDAFRASQAIVAERALATHATVHAPPIGTGLAAASWTDVRAILETELVLRGVSVVIHCLGSEPPR